MEPEALVRQQQHVSDETRLQHLDILDAVQSLEAALASPAIGRTPRWHNRLIKELGPVSDAVSRHCLAAEAPDGLVQELEREIGGRPRILRIVSEEHQSLVQHVESLMAGLKQEEDWNLVRSSAAKLTAALRQHQAHEADLIYEAFCRDIGVGD